MPNKDIPASVETERAVLGAILLDNSVFPQVQLDPGDFFLPAHRVIWSAMQEMRTANVPVDLVTLANKLSTNGTGDALVRIGGPVYLSSLTDGQPRLANIEHYVKIVKDHSRLRLLLQATEEATREALGGTSPDEIEKTIRKRLQRKKKSQPGETARPGTASEQDTEEFFILDDGVHTVVHYKDGAPQDLWVCAPLEIEAVTCDENGDGWGRLLKWKDSDGREHSWAMPMQLLAGSGEDFRRVLLGGGLEISTLKAARDKLMKYVQSQVPQKRAVSVTKVGWHNGVFVFPDGGIGPGDDLIFYQAAQEMSHYLRVQGTAEEWKTYVGRLCSGNSRLLLAVSCAFAAPLVNLTESEAGGFHFYGTSSTGKTTALIVAGSVWGGGGENGYIETWRNTANGLEIFAEIHNDGLGCLDELAEMDPHQLAECLYMLANGQGKGRMTKSISSRRRLTWKLLFLSSGELTLNEHVESVGRIVKLGAEIRLVNITADAGKHMGMFENLHGFSKASEFALHLRLAATQYYGAPIRAFVRHVADHRLSLIGDLRNRMELFLRDAVPPDAPGEMRRASRRFALAVAAGELATKLDLTGWDMKEISPSIQRCFKTWFQTRDPSEEDKAVRAVRQFLELHGSSRFQNADPDMKMDGSYPTERIINRAGFWRLTEGRDAREYLFLPEVFRSEVCRGFDKRTVLDALRTRHFLSVGGDGKNSKVVRIPGVGNQRFYVVHSSIFQ